MALYRGVLLSHPLRYRASSPLSPFRPSKKRRFVTKLEAKEAKSRWWGYTDDVIMFIVKFAFFFILLVMVSQQLLDYGDCTYFRPLRLSRMSLVNGTKHGSPGT